MVAAISGKFKTKIMTTCRDHFLLFVRIEIEIPY